jgi:hypothetical protein
MEVTPTNGVMSDGSSDPSLWLLLLRELIIWTKFPLIPYVQYILNDIDLDMHAYSMKSKGLI